MDPNQNNPYEFIMNPQQPVRRNPLAGGSFLMKVVLIIGIGGILMLGLGIYATSAQSGSTSETLMAIAQQQTEIKRVAESSTTARTQKVKNFGSNTALTFYTNQLQMVTFLGQRGVKVEAKELILKKNPVTDQKLTLARNASEFDEELVKVLQSEIKAYQGSLQAAFKVTKSQKEKELLAGFFSQAQLLIEQSTARY